MNFAVETDNRSNINYIVNMITVAFPTLLSIYIITVVTNIEKYTYVLKHSVILSEHSIRSVR